MFTVPTSVRESGKTAQAAEVTPRTMKLDHCVPKKDNKKYSKTKHTYASLFIFDVSAPGLNRSKRFPGSRDIVSITAPKARLPTPKHQISPIHD